MKAGCVDLLDGFPAPCSRDSLSGSVVVGVGVEIDSGRYWIWLVVDALRPSATQGPDISPLHRRKRAETAG